MPKKGYKATEEAREHLRLAHLGKARTHGMKRTKFYKVFDNLKSRCNFPSYPGYKNYGGRGIKCEWQSFEDFRNDMYDSYLQHQREFGKDTAIDRMDNNGNYSKKNCRWVTRYEQQNNIRSNVTATLTELSNELGIKYLRLRYLTYNKSIPLAKAVALCVKKELKDSNAYQAGISAERVNNPHTYDIYTQSDMDFKIAEYKQKLIKRIRKWYPSKLMNKSWQEGFNDALDEVLKII